MVTVSYTGPTSIDVTWDATAPEPDNYLLQMNRNGNGWLTPATGGVRSSNGSASYTVTIGYDPGGAYGANPGPDSYIEFRVQTRDSSGNVTGEVGNTDFTTTPAPPAETTISRPDATTITLDYTQGSTAVGETTETAYLRVQARQTDGSGTPLSETWQTVTEQYGVIGDDRGTTGLSRSLNTPEGPITNDASWQVRYAFGLWGPQLVGDWVYPSGGPIAFSDGFESGDTSAWSTVNVSNSPGVVSGSYPRANNRMHVDGAVEGSNYLSLYEDDSLQVDIGGLDTSKRYALELRCACARINELGGVRASWNDGSGWTELLVHGGSWSGHGWTTRSVEIPPGIVDGSTNTLRLQTDAYNFDDYAVDAVTVREIGEEQTLPATVADLQADTPETGEGIDATWTVQSDMANARYNFVYRVNGGSWQSDQIVSDVTTSSWALDVTVGSDDVYELQIWTAVDQLRNGSIAQTFQNKSAIVAVQLPLQAPTDVVLVSVDGDDVTIGWTPSVDSHDSQGVYRSRDGGSTWATVTESLGTTVTEYTDPDLLDGERYTFTVAAIAGSEVAREDESGSITEPSAGGTGGNYGLSNYGLSSHGTGGD